MSDEENLYFKSAIPLIAVTSVMAAIYIRGEGTLKIKIDTQDARYNKNQPFF